MSRPLRIEIPGGFYHVTARGIEKRDIFVDRKDFLKMLELFEMYSERLGILIHGFVLMNNHYHLMLETPGANITSFMHNLQSHYSNYFNNRHERVGHLFQGRYKALIVDKESYLVELSRYIHLNPVRAGLVGKPDEWAWSSYGAYCGVYNDSLTWVHTKEVLKYFGSSEPVAVNSYRKYIFEAIDEEPENPLGNAVAQLVLGPNEFVERVKSQIHQEGKRIDSEISTGKSLMKWTSEQADEIIARIADLFSEKPENILNPNGYRNIARKSVIMMFFEYSRWRNSEIGKKFGISGAGVSKIRERFPDELKKNPKLEGKNKELNEIAKNILSNVSA